MSDNFKNSTPHDGSSEHRWHKHLWTVATGNQQEEPAMPDDPPPNSMRGRDLAATLREVETPDAPSGQGSDARAAPRAICDSPTVAVEDGSDADADDSDELDEYELAYADGTKIPPEASHRGFFRRRDEMRHRADDPIVDAVSASQVDVWAAHRGGAENGARHFAKPPQSGVESEIFNERTSHRRRRAAMLALLGALIIGFAVLVLGATGGSRGGATPTHARDHVRSAPTKHAAGPAHHTVRNHARATTTPVHARKMRRHAKEHRVVRDPTKLNRRAVDTTPAIVSTTPTYVQHPTRAVSISPSTGGSSSSTDTASTTHSRSSSQSSAGSGTVPAGALPDVQQTEQQP